MTPLGTGVGGGTRPGELDALSPAAGFSVGTRTPSPRPTVLERAPSTPEDEAVSHTSAQRPHKHSTQCSRRDHPHVTDDTGRGRFPGSSQASRTHGPPASEHTPAPGSDRAAGKPGCPGSIPGSILWVTLGATAGPPRASASSGPGDRGLLSTGSQHRRARQGRAGQAGRTPANCSGPSLTTPRQRVHGQSAPDIPWTPRQAPPAPPPRRDSTPSSTPPTLASPRGQKGLT